MCAAEPVPILLDVVNALSTVVMAAATVVVGWVAVVEVLERKRARADRRRAVQGRISALAYALRRQLRSWHEEDHPHDKVTFLRWGETIRRHFNRAEERLADLMSLAADADASPAVREAVRQTFVEFYDATGIVNREIDVGGSPGAALQLSSAFDGIKKSAQTIDDAIDPELRRR